MIVNKFNGNGGGGGSYTLPTATSSRLGGVKIGEGINVQNDGTISVTGGTGGGIEKVNVLPQSAEEGDVVWLNGETKTGYTILCAESDAGWPWELDRVVISVNGSTDGYRLRLGDAFVPGRWGNKFTGLLMRVRLNEDDYPILDVIDLTGENTIAPGPDAVSMESGVTFPMKGCLYVYGGGMWKAKPEFEWEYNATEAPAIIDKIYKGIEEFGLDDFVIRYKLGGRYPAREFKCYSGAHYGLDFKCSDDRSGDWGNLSVFAYRLEKNGNFSDQVGEQSISVDSTIRGWIPNTKLEAVTQAQYDALVSGGTVDSNVLYVIV